ncbi:hypothetical protein ACLMJK_003167 [Lecanora helva]
MTALPPTDKSSGAKRHSRVISASRTPLARRSTKGPLDVDDSPVDKARPPSLESTTADAAKTPIPQTPFSPERSLAEPVSAPPPPPPAKDYGYLLRPELYHPISQVDLPPQFRSPQHQPPPSTPISELLSNHHFRSAAIAAALRLCTPPAPPQPELFSLLYTRLACLTLINHLAFAAEESKALQDIHNPFYTDETTGESVLPWELKVITVRLQAIGYSDAKRGVSGYYELAKEARAAVTKCRDPEEKAIWKERLQDLGIYVANALIESGNLSAAARHLESLRSKHAAKRNENKRLDARLALIYIQLGDIDAARKYLSYINTDTEQSNRTTTTTTSALLQPLLSLASGNYDLAVTELQSLSSALPNNSSDIVTQNLAVCLFYTGRVDEALKLLEGLVDERGRNFRPLLFNLATVYELVGEKGRERKGALVERVSGGMGGGERGLVDFKL